MKTYTKFTVVILFEDGGMDVSKIAIDAYEDETMIYSYLAPRITVHKGRPIKKITINKNYNETQRVKLKSKVNLQHVFQIGEGYCRAFFVEGKVYRGYQDEMEDYIITLDNSQEVVIAHDGELVKNFNIEVL